MVRNAAQLEPGIGPGHGYGFWAKSNPGPAGFGVRPSRRRRAAPRSIVSSGTADRVARWAGQRLGTPVRTVGAGEEPADLLRDGPVVRALTGDRASAVDPLDERAERV